MSLQKCGHPYSAVFICTTSEIENRQMNKELGNGMLREVQIRRNAEALIAAQSAAALTHAQSAAAWISSNRPDVYLGVEPKICLVANDDSLTLPQLEDYGRAGNAVKLCDGPFGELWWCDPEGRKSGLHQCLLYAAKVTSMVAGRTVLLRFHRKSA